MASAKPAVVIVHGGWQSPTTRLLHLFGWLVMKFMSMNREKTPGGDFITDTAPVRSVVEGLVEAGRTIIVLLQSYGGQVGTNALYGLSLQSRAEQGLTGGLSNLIYLSAFILPKAWATLDQAHALG